MKRIFPDDRAGADGARVLGMRKRTWLALGASLLVLIALVAWAAIAAVSWVVREAPALADAGQRAAGEVVQQAERIAPGLEQQAQDWLRGAQEGVGQVLPGVQERVEAWVPEAKERLGAWLPERDGDQPREVSGSDIGPVPPYAGLTRAAYSREAGAERVRYVGAADLRAVLDHYVRGFAAAGYAGDVLAATQDAEHHRFVRGDSSYELKLTRLSERVEVELARKAVTGEA